jgi:4-amino-4-deoxy-L-arabinose transferase-like glycosyltransferase
VDWVVAGLLLSVVGVAASEVGFWLLDRDVNEDRTSEGRLFFRVPFLLLLAYELWPDHRRSIRLVQAVVAVAAGMLLAYLWFGPSDGGIGVDDADTVRAAADLLRTLSVAAVTVGLAAYVYAWRQKQSDPSVDPLRVARWFLGAAALLFVGFLVLMAIA